MSADLDDEKDVLADSPDVLAARELFVAASDLRQKFARICFEDGEEIVAGGKAAFAALDRLIVAAVRIRDAQRATSAALDALAMKTGVAP